MMNLVDYASDSDNEDWDQPKTQGKHLYFNIIKPA
jgi:hypothetical protein